MYLLKHNACDKKLHVQTSILRFGLLYNTFTVCISTCKYEVLSFNILDNEFDNKLLICFVTLPILTYNISVSQNLT